MTGNEKDTLTRTEDAIAAALDAREGLWWVRTWVLGLYETGARPDRTDVAQALRDCNRAWRGLERTVGHLRHERGKLPSGREL